MIKITPVMKLRFIHVGIAVACLAVMVISFIVIMADEKISHPLKIFLTVAIQIGGALFFALTAGYVSDALQRAKGHSSLWLLGEEFRKAGLLDFYADREGGAKTDLDEAFKVHQKGEVLMIGASLRKFLASGQPHEPQVRELLRRKGVSVRAIFNSPESNRELPVRSFIEVFNRGESSPKAGNGTLDMKKEINFSFDKFVENFYETYVTNRPDIRPIADLRAARTGVGELNDIAKSAGSSIMHRESKSAPYCTVIIFPEKAFYTPNLLSTKMPVNFPTLVFHKTSEIYKRLVEYFEFLWWVNDPEPELRSEDV